MNRFRILPFVSALIAGSLDVWSQEMVNLCNGKDLSGWVNVNCAPETWSVRDGVIHCTGKPTGALRTERQYENFVLELEWRHLKPGGNAGIFIWASPESARGQPFLRAIEVQVLDHAYGKSDWFTTHGDVFPIHGSRMKPHGRHRGMRSFPSEERSKASPEWNHYKIHCNDGVLRLEVNGKEVSGGRECHWRKGYVALESEGSPVEFRNIKLRELPSTHATEEESAPEALGFRNLYTGTDFRGWKVPPGSEEHWRSRDWRIVYDGKSEAEEKNLWTEESFKDFELTVDWKLSREPVARRSFPKLLASGEYEKGADGKNVVREIECHGDSGVFLRGSRKAQINIWSWPNGSGELWGYRNAAKTPEQRRACTPLVRADQPFGRWNRFRIVLKGKVLNIWLNDRQVIKDAVLDDIPDQGPIGLQHHGDPLEFANIYVRTL